MIADTRIQDLVGNGRGGDAAPDWLAPPAYPLDLNGPVDRPFPRLEESFCEVPAFEHLERIAASHGSKLAVSDGFTELSYSELLGAVRQLAWLIAAAVPEGEAVGLLLGNCVWYPVAMLAAMASGRPAVSFNPRDPTQRLNDVLSRARLSVIVCDQAELSSGLADPGRHWIDPAHCMAPATRPDRAFQPRPGSVDAPALVLPTSGSTGEPKGIANSQRGLLLRVQQAVNACHIGPSDIFMPLTGPATIAGCREMMTAILSGATLYLADIESVGLRSIRQLLQSRRVTVTYVVPALLRVLARGAPAGTFASLRIVRIGGEKVLWSDIDVVREAVPDSCFVQVSYSSTEAIGTQWFLPKGHPEAGATVPVGYLVPGLEYVVADEQGHALAAEGEGELLIRSAYTTLGTWENGRVVPLPADPGTPSRRILATGDLVKIDGRGLTWIVGRKGRLIKINGRRVEPAELELVLRRSPDVSDAVAIVTDDNQIVVFVVPEAGAGPGLVEALRDLVRMSLPTALQPARLHCVESLPRLRGGKVDGAALRALDAGLADRRQEPSAAEVADEAGDMDGIEPVVAQVWRAILKRDETSGRWDELGGDSLRLLQLAMELETRFGREFSLDAFTVDMRFSDVVRAVSGTGAGRTSGADKGSPQPTLFMLPGSIGYGPSLAAFGVEMSDVAHVVAVRYPDLVDILAGHESISVMADMVFEQISLVQPEGEVALIGYSLGGAVAFEVARRLIAAGRTIPFLGILDTNILPVAYDFREAVARTAQRIRAHRMTLDRLLCRAIAKICVRRGREAWLAGCIQRLTWQPLAKARFMLRLELEDVLRMQAFWRWLSLPRTPLPIAATVFRCDRQHLAADLGWSKLFDSLEVVSIAGGHLDMLVAPHLAHNRPLIARALVAAEGGTPVRPR
ncbi:non-ribosomal peptide synthetase [Kaistia adipata]|uniref:non-ribosomal peptide synthetase n=1 Tax=Kaistia adipata TaxID=166954 RepID=UPI001FE01A86|nr:non-ribosomal peptide synthetase [Kaistia adipata]